MKKIYCIILLSFINLTFVIAQSNKGKVVYDRLYSESLENDAGENPERRVTIYLPPNYDNTTNEYPVMYYLHGFTWSDSMQVVGDHFDQLLDKAINEGIIQPLIVVMPDQHTLYRGSFYTNSTFTGNWADFTAIDLVNYIDKNYRTLDNRESRGIAGHSMGGYGAIKLGMQHPDVFSVVYGLSPAVLDYTKEISPTNFSFKRIPQLKTREEVITGYAEFYPNAIIAMARAFSPNPNNPPFYIDLPYLYEGNQLIINDKVLKLWNNQSPVNMVESHVDKLRKLTAIKFDWGRNEENLHIPPTCKAFSRELELYGIKHFAEEYLGDHTNILWTQDGRAITDLFPFFNQYLKFE